MSPSTTLATTTTLDPVATAIADGYVALCSNGDFSDNTDFDATCSGGDGVDIWLAPFGECNDGTVIRMSRDANCSDHDGFRGLLPPDFVPSPGETDLARCANGTFSDNTDLNAICSANGGVAEWLAPFGECNDGTIVAMGQETCDGHDGFAALLPPDFAPPTTTTTTMPPPTLDERLATSIDETLQSGELRDIERARGRLTVTVRSRESLTEGLTKDQARYSVAEVLEGARNGHLPPRITTVSVRVLYDLVNQFGEEAEEVVIEADYTRPTLDRIVFDNIDTTKILLLADGYPYVHPAMAKADGS
jgi:hypothetical protein